MPLSLFYPRQSCVIFLWISLLLPLKLWAVRIDASVLHEAVSRWDLPAAQSLLDEDSKLLTAEDSLRSTPLHRAARQGNAAMVTLLLGAGAHVNRLNNQGFTPLHRAVHGGHIEVVRLLLERGAALGAPDGGETPEAAALHAQYVQIADLLNRAKRQRLQQGVVEHCEALPKQARLVTEFLRSQEAVLFASACSIGFLRKNITKENVNVRDLDGNTLLHCIRGEGPQLLEAANILLNAGAEVNAVNQRGATPLLNAAERGNLELVRFLIENGATVDSGEALYFGGALHRAAYGGPRIFGRRRQDVGVLAFLLQHDPSLMNALDRMGNTPLHYAARYGRLHAVQLLLDAGADTALVNLRGETPLRYVRENLIPEIEVGDIVAMLEEAEVEAGNERMMAWAAAYVNLEMERLSQLHLAATRGDEAVVQALLEADPEGVNQTDHNGYTALHLAAWNGRANIARILLQAGAHRSITAAGQTAQELAVQRGHNTVAVLLEKAEESEEAKKEEPEDLGSDPEFEVGLPGCDEGGTEYDRDTLPCAHLQIVRGRALPFEASW